MSTPTLDQKLKATSLTEDERKYVEQNKNAIAQMYNWNPYRKIQDHIVRHKAANGIAIDEIYVHDTFYQKSPHVGHKYDTQVTNTTKRTWKIDTSKTYSGNLVSCATEILSEHIGDGVSSEQVDVHNIVHLINKKVRVTKKAAKDQHIEAIEIFKQKLNDMADDQKSGVK